MISWKKGGLVDIYIKNFNQIVILKASYYGDPSVQF